jgi:hypothetical protein
MAEIDLMFSALIRQNRMWKKIQRATNSLMDHVRMTRRNNFCESAHWILLAAEKEAAYI